MPPTTVATTTTEVTPTALAGLCQRERLALLKHRLLEMANRGPGREPRIYRHGPAEALRQVPGEDVPTPLGAVRATLTEWPLGYCHGSAPIARAHAIEPRVIAALALDPSLLDVDTKRLLFLDTETTGLAGGTGTLAFLVGLGWFEDRAFVVEQLLLTKPGEETPLLTELARRLQAASAIVTFNGKSFDWPLLRTRFVMNRMSAPAPPHLDLLHMARRVYRQRLSSLKLKAVEEAVLDLEREDTCGRAQCSGYFGASGHSRTPGQRVFGTRGRDGSCRCARLRPTCREAR
jgi:uncharacterized protein